jgi:Domain of unknown function (DUF4345)
MIRLSPIRERCLLQSAVAILGLVPVLAGAVGVVWGLGAFDAHFHPSVSGDSHLRYLSGLILAIGLGFWSTVPRIQVQGPRFRLLTCLVLIGGIARFYALARYGTPGIAMLMALLMEIVVTPGLAIWRERVQQILPASAIGLDAAS